MGLLANLSARLQKAFANDKDQVLIRAAQGATAPLAPSGYNLLQSYGYDVLADYLRLDNSLLERYADAEEMQEYPELACVSADLRVLVPGVPGSAPTVRDLVAQQERGERGDDLLVYAFDHARGCVVVAPAKGPRQTGTQAPVYRVTFEEYRASAAQTWSVRTTANHLFMLRDGSYRPASKLKSHDRLMPCTVQVHPTTEYLVVYEPLRRTKSGQLGRTKVHRLVMRAMLGRDLTDSEVVLHRDRNKANADPANLELTTKGDLLREHLGNPEEEATRLAALSATTRENWSDPLFKKRMSASQRTGNSKWLKREASGDYARPQQGKPSEARRAAIGAGNRIPLAKDVLEAALRASGSVNEAGRRLGVSWNTVMRRMAAFGLDAEIVGSNLGGPQPGEASYQNHRVVSVEFAGYEDVYDIEVPGYHNFAVGDPSGDGFVFVHNSALDLYADDVTQTDVSTNRVVWAVSKNTRVKTEIDNMIRRLDLDEELWEIARTTCMYGNDFEEMIVNEDGLIALNFLPAPSMRRIEGRHGELYGFIQDPRGKIGYSVDDFKVAMAKREALISGNIKAGEAGTEPTVAFEGWEVVHFRLRGAQRRSVYGRSVLDSARWIWRRLLLLEDAAMIYRLQRAPERFAFYVNVGDRSEAEARNYLNRMRQQFKKTKYINPRTGQLDFKTNPISGDEDIYIPFRAGEDGSRVEMLSAPAWQHMDDVEYFRSKLFSAIKIPKAYLGDEEGTVRSTLSAMDIRFARTVLRVQRAIRAGVHKMARTHLAAINIDPNSVEFDIGMVVPSSLLELAQVEARAARADLASRMRDFVSLHWVLANVFNLNDEDIKTIFLQRDEDITREGKAQMAAQGGGGGFGGDMGALPPEGEVPPEGAEMSAPEEAPPEGEPPSEEPGPFERRGGSRRKPIFEARRMTLEMPSGRRFRGNTRPITERELFAGAKQQNNDRLLEKVDKLLKHDRELASRLEDIAGLVQELRSRRT